MGKNIINRPGEHVELENSLCVTGHLLPTPAQKDFATEPELFWRVQVNPTQGQAATSEPFPHTVHFPKPAFPIPGQCKAGRSCPPAQAPPAWAGSLGLRTLQSKSLSVPWTLHLPWGFSSVFSQKKPSQTVWGVFLWQGWEAEWGIVGLWGCVVEIHFFKIRR